MAMREASRDRLERRRRRAAERELETSPMHRIAVPSVGWISTPSVGFGVASLIDIPGVTLRINPFRFTAAADAYALRQDFSAIAGDLRRVTDVVIEDESAPRLFDVSNL